MSTNVTEFIGDLDAGVFEEKLSRALSDVAMGVVTQSKPGKVSITFEMKQIGQSSTVNIAHKLTYSKPTASGKLSEENTTETPMHVNQGGKLTLFPEDQGQLFGKKGEVPASPDHRQ